LLLLENEAMEMNTKLAASRGEGGVAGLLLAARALPLRCACIRC
jgi:hypothetical protein